MIKLICLLKRRPGMSPEEFHRYWREEHGPLVASTNSATHVTRYEQNHRSLSSYAADPDGFDGVTEQWFTSDAEFNASIREADFQRIQEDLPKFLDTDALVFLLTDEPEVVISGRTLPDAPSDRR